MNTILDFLSPVFSGLCACLVLYLLARSTKQNAISKAGYKVLEYNRGIKLLAAISIPFAIFVVYAASQARESQVIIAATVAFFFVFAAVFITYQVFFVRLAYNATHVLYKSPVRGELLEPWTSLRDIGYSALVQSDFLLIDGIGRIWCSNLLNGYSELGDFLEEKANELLIENEG